LAPKVEAAFPPLPLEEWERSKETLHRFAQVVGKVRLGYAPFMNHWWHATLYVGTRGLTTGPIPYEAPSGDSGTFEILFDLLENRLVVSTSEGEGFQFALDDLPVADFYSGLIGGLATLGIPVSIDPTPFDLPDDDTLDRNVFHRVCDRDHARRYWRTLVTIDGVFREFAGRFNGKTSPVHLFWHSFDLALGRFSGRRAPEREGADPVTREAYSHEIISFGFWPGDRATREPHFYSYTAPEPAGLTDQLLEPDAAYWTPEGGTALLPYEAVRTSGEPRETLLRFLQSAYEAGANTAGWDVEAFRTGAG
jgi:hypothetical protein